MSPLPAPGNIIVELVSGPHCGDHVELPAWAEFVRIDGSDIGRRSGQSEAAGDPDFELYVSAERRSQTGRVVFEHRPRASTT